MTDRYVHSALDFSEWTPIEYDDEGGKMLDVEQMRKMFEEPDTPPTEVELTDTPPEEGGLDNERLRRMAAEPDAPLSADDELKEALLLQNFQDRFIVPDPSDNLSDDELWALMPESIRRSK